MRLRSTFRRFRLLVVVAVLALAAAVVVPLVTSLSSGYQARLVMPVAAGVYKGLQLRINNIPAGEVTDVAVRDGKAVVDVVIDEENAPLHRGAKPLITKRSLVGEVYLQLDPGPANSPALPSGSSIETNWSHVEVEDLLETLDAPTRKKVQSLLGNTSATLGGREKDVNATVPAAGRAVRSLGQVLAAVGEDGPAIRGLITRLDRMMSAVASRRTDLSAAVTDLATITEKVSARQQQLSTGLRELPGTLRQAQSTLDKVPRTVRSAQPLLADLQPAAAKLPSVSGKLRPLLDDLQPAVAQLRPTLASADSLLRQTPTLLDSAHAVLPSTTRALNGLAPALNYLRPYTPDLVGWLSNWAGVFGGYSSQGHYGHLLLSLSGTSFHNNPGVKPPGLTFDHTTAPGTGAGQPWTDASGEPVK